MEDIIEKVSTLARRLSKEILLPNYARVKSVAKDDGSWLTIADTQAHDLLVETLPEIANYPVLSEEMSVNEQQEILDKPSANYWCIDPLDGTSNFTQGIPYWCTSIALIKDGKMDIAVVYDGTRDECFAATSLSETTLNGQPLKNKQASEECDLKSAMGLIDFKRLDKYIAASLVTDQPYRSQRSFGASALDLCWIAASRCQIYLHGQQKLWDHAAGMLILEQASGVAKTFTGENVFQNNLQHKTVIAACNDNYFALWNEYFNQLISQEKS